MFTSEKNPKTVLKELILYIGITAFIALFGFIYEQFSHGVNSLYMWLAWLWVLGFGHRAEELAGKAGGLAHHHLAVGEKGPVHLTVHADVGGRDHVSVDGRALGDTADVVHILLRGLDRLIVAVR